MVLAKPTTPPKNGLPAAREVKKRAPIPRITAPLFEENKGQFGGKVKFLSRLNNFSLSLGGGGGSDKFRLKVWDKATGNIVYDNQIGASDSENPSTVIGGGSIIIHK